MGIDAKSEKFEVIHAYTRAQAIEDGVLVDLSGLASEAGFRWPLAVTQAVWAVVEPESDTVEAPSFRCYLTLYYSRGCIVFCKTRRRYAAGKAAR